MTNNYKSKLGAYRIAQRITEKKAGRPWHMVAALRYGGAVHCAGCLSPRQIVASVPLDWDDLKWIDDGHGGYSEECADCRCGF